MNLLTGRLEWKAFRWKLLCVFGILEGEGTQEMKLLVKDQPFPKPLDSFQQPFQANLEALGLNLFLAFSSSERRLCS